MADLTAKKVNKLIEEFSQTGKEPQKLIIGYKTYARLMTEDKFAEKVVPSLEDSKERLYKNLKIIINTFIMQSIFKEFLIMFFIF